MFVAIDQNDAKQFAFHEDDKERLYSLAQSKELYCPHCHKHVFFRGGPKRIHHFYHERHVECSFVGEPETQEHLGGKLAIYNWLKEQYPNAYVVLLRPIKSQMCMHILGIVISLHLKYIVQNKQQKNGWNVVSFMH